MLKNIDKDSTNAAAIRFCSVDSITSISPTESPIMDVQPWTGKEDAARGSGLKRSMNSMTTISSGIPLDIFFNISSGIPRMTIIWIDKKKSFILHGNEMQIDLFYIFCVVGQVIPFQ